MESVMPRSALRTQSLRSVQLKQQSSMSRRHHLAQLARIELARGVAPQRESCWHLRVTERGHVAPTPTLGLDHVVGPAVVRVAGLIFGHERLVNLLAWSDADRFDLGARRNGRGE